MEIEQELEWLEAQKIVISENIVSVAKQQLQFLAAVDRNRCLYEGPVLQRAIYRYNACWLPLLAKHSESQISEGPLVVPLDCEWVWHCHRLNPVQYKSDTEKLYGRVLDNYNVVSSIQGISKEETEEIWNGLYPEEPYHLDLTTPFLEDVSEKFSAAEKFIKYDLATAVKRQRPFFYQVSRPHMNNDLFLEGAAARYKGFLHLIKRNRENSLKCFCVPTYDIDLIWHSHQLNPVSYCKDLTKVLGKVLEHDDTDSDRTKGKKLDVGFSETTKQWEETFGSRYWRAGAMYRGSAPSPLPICPCPSDFLSKKVVASNGCKKIIQLPEVKFVEVLLEIVGVKNLPEGHKGSLFVSFRKKKPDIFFNATRRLTILSESGEKQVASFQCEPTGELLFELMSHAPSNLSISRPSKAMGCTSVSLQDLLAPDSKLYLENWVALVPSSGKVSPNPICLRIAVSITVPAPAPHDLRMVRSRPFSKSSCFFPLLGRVQDAKSWTHVIDDAGSEVISLQMRDSKKAKDKRGNESMLSKEVVGLTKFGEPCTLAEFVGNGWSLLDSLWSLQLQPNSSDIHIFELTGSRTVKIFPGRKLEYEHTHYEKRRHELDFFTAVEFTAEDPHGKAVALLDLKFGFLKVKEEWFVLPGITLAFILSNVLSKEGYNGFVGGEIMKGTENSDGKVNVCCEENHKASQTGIVAREVELKTKATEGSTVMPEGCSSRSGVCEGACGNKYANAVLESGGCGGCGSGCGAGCGGGCGNMAKSAGCGGCGGSGCGDTIETSGCGGCGGSGCGDGTSANGSHAGNPCADERPVLVPVHANEALVA
ncbi:glycine-rich domain-containing protein 1-like [Malania oleifera]|uniref:glycine-rich domain-containing protein 1-like n=1 Tax=Malania oleifera TaxID=397392 RepID=UPI0025ADF25E|nr:glycine-rich domain-containing protein 1-like [Malania oleifera]